MKSRCLFAILIAMSGVTTAARVTLGGAGVTMNGGGVGARCGGAVP